MTDDIVKRLRTETVFCPACTVFGCTKKVGMFSEDVTPADCDCECHDLARAAADEIERLRALVAIGDDLAYWLEDYATFDDDDSRARQHITVWKHYRKEAGRD